MVDYSVPMIGRRIECIKLQWNTAGIDDANPGAEYDASLSGTLGLYGRFRGSLSGSVSSVRAVLIMSRTSIWLSLLGLATAVCARHLDNFPFYYGAVPAVAQGAMALVAVVAEPIGAHLVYSAFTCDLWHDYPPAADFRMRLRFSDAAFADSSAAVTERIGFLPAARLALSASMMSMTGAKRSA
jgi:hypothetical protein